MATLKNLTIDDTGFLQVPTGTTGERAGSPQAGMLRYNTSNGVYEIYSGSQWTAFQGQVSATGGSTTTAGGARIHTFTSGTSTFTINYPGLVEILCVGGGGGGATIGGGGGAGGYVYQGQTALSAGSYSVRIGGGGGGENNHNDGANAPGTPSYVRSPSGVGLSIDAVGGGRGLSYTRTSTNNVRLADGGSGGGGPGGHIPNPLGGKYPSENTGWGSSPANHWTGRPMSGFRTGNTRDQVSVEANGYGGGVLGQGHPGGAGCHGNGYRWIGNTRVYGGGGGGGAGSSGQPRTNSLARATGGGGLSSAISGSVAAYAGGGGGGLHGPGNTGHYGIRSSQGGSGVGGLGGEPGRFPGQTNRGGGGGGGQHNAGDRSGLGGPGVVIIKYIDP